MVKFLAVTVLPFLFLSLALGYALYRSYGRGDCLLAFGSLILVFMLVHQAVELRDFVLHGAGQDLLKEIPETLVNTIGSLVILLLANSRYRLTETKCELEEALTRKETLLQEIHHRVKNNLQLVVSLLNLQSSQLESDAGSEALEEIASRVRSMAILHENLYSPSSVEELDTANYFRELLETSLQSASLEPSRIENEIDVNVGSLGLETALHCGVIVNELVNNAIEHGLGDEPGTVGVGLETENAHYELRVWDSGGRYSPGSDDKGETMGLNLVRTMATDHLNGTLDVSVGDTTVFTVRFPKSS